MGKAPSVPADVDATRARACEVPRAEVATLGEVMVLFWPARHEPLAVATLYERSFGGAEGNFAIALARLGHRARWISRLGDDVFGRYVRAELEREGVYVDARADPAAPTAVFFKERVLAGPRQVFYYRRGSAASRLSPDDLRPDQLTGVRILHLTGITPALSATCAAAVDRAIELARASGALVSFDPNVRLQLWPSAEACGQALRELAGRADVVLLGHEDAAVLYPGLGEREVVQAVRAAGATTAVLKLGERGAMAVRGDEWARVAAHRVDVVVDTVGAGDGFDAGFVAGLLRGFALERCLTLAARVGAGAVAVAGDWEGYPTAAEVDL